MICGEGAARVKPRGAGWRSSIAREGGVHLAGPGVDATGDVDGVVPTLGTEKLRGAEAAAAVVAEDEQRAVAGEIGAGGGQPRERQQAAAREGDEGVLGGLAHVEEARTSMAPGGGGSDVDLERWVQREGKIGGRRGMATSRFAVDAV